jgi:hypothetical protein
LKPNLSAAGLLCEDRDSRTVMTGLVPVIHVVKLLESLGMAVNGAAWMAGTSPAMTERAVRLPYRSI